MASCEMLISFLINLLSLIHVSFSVFRRLSYQISLSGLSFNQHHFSLKNEAESYQNTKPDFIPEELVLYF